MQHFPGFVLLDSSGKPHSLQPRPGVTPGTDNTIMIIRFPLRMWLLMPIGHDICHLSNVLRMMGPIILCNIWRKKHSVESPQNPQIEMTNRRSSLLKLPEPINRVDNPKGVSLEAPRAYKQRRQPEGHLSRYLQTP